MILLERLKGKLRAKREDNASQYWGTLQKIASGKLSERAADEALEALATIMDLLGKSADDAQNDVELLVQLADAESRTAGLDEAKKANRAAMDARTAAQKRAEEALQESQRLARECDDAVRRGQARIGAIESAQQECISIRLKLSKAGHPPSQHRRADEEARDRFEMQSRQIESKLDEVDREIRSTEESAKAQKQSPPRFQGESDGIAASLAHLQSTRDRLNRELTELRREEEIRVAKARMPGKALGGGS